MSVVSGQWSVVSGQLVEGRRQKGEGGKPWFGSLICPLTEELPLTANY